MNNHYYIILALSYHPDTRPYHSSPYLGEKHTCILFIIKMYISVSDSKRQLIIHNSTKKIINIM